MKFILLVSLAVLGSVLDAQTLEGIASYYGSNFHGRSTSTGETFDRNGHTAACKVYPYGTILRVTNLENNQSTQVRVNDCGPAVDDRVIDLSERAARDIGIVDAGLIRVRTEVISLGTDGPTCSRGAWSRGGRQPIDWAGRQARFAVNLPMTQGAQVGSLNDQLSPQPAPSAGNEASLAQLLAADQPTTASNRVTVSGNAALSPPPVAPTNPGLSRPGSDTPPAAPGNATVSSSEPSTYSPSSTAVRSTNEEVPATGPLYAVQLVAVREQSNADAMIERLTAAGFPGAIAIKGGNLYRVFSKPVSFRAQADYWKDKLAEAGFNGIIRRIR